MAAEEENNKKNEGKGFAGLSSLVSDVDTTPPPPAPKTESAGSTTSTGRPASQAAQPQSQQPTQRQAYQEPPQPSSGSSGGKWILGIAAVVGLLWLIGQSDKDTPSPSPAYSPPAQSAAPSYSPPAQPQAPSVPQESKPPVGQDLVFSTAQIRYCLAEDIRLEGAKLAINNYNDADVDRFNASVADYNSRCGSFQYQTSNRGRNDLTSAQRDIEPFRSQYLAEGRSRFARGTTSSIPSAASPVAERSIPDDAALQSMVMDSLRLRPGTGERMVDSGKMIVALANSGYVNLKPDESWDYSDYRFLKKRADFLGHEIIVIEEEYFEKWIGCCVNPGLAITFKLNGNTDFLQTFARNNKCKIGFDGDKYYGPALPPAPKGTYATLSCKEGDSQ